MKLTLSGNRKFIVATLAVGLSFTLACFGKLTADDVNIVIAVIMAFSGANAAEHFAKGWAGRKS